MTKEAFDVRMEHYKSLTSSFLRDVMRRAEVSGALREAMEYSLFAGGKMLRSSLCLTACELVHGEIIEALPAAAAIEMIHTYSLIHDDLPAMDNDSLRRGKPTNHIVFGEANAILAGDGLQSLAFYTLADCRNTEVVRLVADCAFSMVEGQTLDMEAPKDMDELRTIHQNKTGALIRAAVLSGAMLGRATSQQLFDLNTFAENYGLLFQITDDILDAEGDAALLGKTVGKDAIQKKMTFVSAYGLDGARNAAQQAGEAALRALDGFSENASFFVHLVHQTLTRRR